MFILAMCDFTIRERTGQGCHTLPPLTSTISEGRGGDQVDSVEFSSLLRIIMQNSQTSRGVIKLALEMFKTPID